MAEQQQEHKDDGSERQDEVFEFVLGGPAKYTRQELVDKAGVRLDQAQQLWQAMGFAQVGDDEQAFTESDLSALQIAKELLDSGYVDEKLMRVLARSMAQTISRLADSHVAAYAEYVSQQAPNQDDPDLTSAPLVDQVEWLLPRLDKLIGLVWRRQLAGSLQQLLPHAAGEEGALSVGFTDLAGFTKLSRQLTRLELSSLTETFEQEASAVIADLGGRLVKTIGDEVMFFATEARDAVEISLRLIERLAEIDDLPAVHAGVATGPVLLRLGDVFGSTVNLAARLTSIARPDSLLIDQATAEALEGTSDLSIKQTRPRKVSGFSRLSPFAVRRASSRSGSGQDASD